MNAASEVVALRFDCKILHSEDMRGGMRFDYDLTIANPFIVST